MSFSILKEQSFGTLPKPYSISSILNLTSDSNEIIELYDTNPNLVGLLDSEKGKIVIKCFGWRSNFHFLISPLMYSRARMSWETASVLDSVGITPKPLFVHTKKKFGFKYENFFITEAIETHVKFRKFIKEEKNVDKLKIVINNLAIALAKMHRLNIYHRDLTTGNFLIDQQYSIYIVDLNRARHLNKISMHKRVKDLAKIHFPKTSIFTQENTISYFFGIYSKESQIELDWVTEYWKIRNKLLARRNRSKNIRNIFRTN